MLEIEQRYQKITDEQKQAVTEAHRERLRRSLSEIPEDVLATVRDLKNMGFKLGVISNADVTDTANWGSSPLRPWILSRLSFSQVPGRRSQSQCPAQ